VPAIPLLVTGLAIWLAGMFFRRSLLTASSAFALIAAFLTLKIKSMPQLCIAFTVGAAIGAFSRKIATAILAALIVTALLTFAFSTIGKPAENTPTSIENPKNSTTAFFVVKQFEDVLTKLKTMSTQNKIIILSAVIIVAFSAFLFARPALCFCFSFIGLAFISVAMLLLLTRKGTDLNAMVSNNARLITVIYTCCLVFGAFVQFVLGPKDKKKVTKPVQSDKNTQS
jgi:hypothetical protein